MSTELKTEVETQLEKFTILIVDDVPRNIQLVANFLTKFGFEINFALDGNKAIEHAKRTHFDLILLDIMMPGIDGFEVCRNLKANPETADVPVIFLTAKTDDESIAKGFDAGGVDYITKPFNPTELLARIKTHVRLRHREIELTNLNRTKDVFLSIIGHDLKTPLANIVSLSDLLVSNSAELNSVDKMELMYDIAESGQQGIWLLENLLSWTRVQTGKIQYDPQRIVLHNVIKRNITFITPNAIRKKIQIHFDCQDKLEFYTDPNIFDTILRNLLSNAVKFTPLEGDIFLKASMVSGNEILITIKDTGVGIEPERVTTLFSQVTKHSSTQGTQNEKGSGLGLVLVKELVELIHANIEVESKLNEGTTFYLHLNIEN